MDDSHNKTALNDKPASQRQLERLEGTSRHIATTVIDFIFPPLCLNCQTELDAPNHLCSPCWQDITFLVEPLCHVKGTPLPYDINPFNNDQPTISADALANPPIYDQARSIAHYDGTMRALIHKFKYQDRHELTSLFATWLMHFGRTQLSRADLLIPVPLYKWRFWQRRFNQSAEIAKRLSTLSGIPCDVEPLIRTKKTRAQVGLSFKERQNNVRNAFYIPPSKVKAIENKTVILIDDVITTGATVNAAATKLKDSGVSSVIVLSLATVTKELIETF